MLVHLFFEDLMCELTHLAVFFSAFPWFLARFGLFFAWKKIASSFGFLWRVVTGLRPNCRSPPEAIGELYFCTGRGFYPISLRDQVPISPLPDVSSCSSAGASASAPACFPPAVLSPVREVPRLEFSFASRPPTIVKGESNCYFLDCAFARGLPCVGGGLVPSFPPFPQYHPSVPLFAFVGEVISQSWLAENASCLGSEALPAPSLAGCLAFATSSSFVSCSGDTSSDCGTLSRVVSLSYQMNHRS
ncbi:uncharacterized protein EV154DRAFT_487826 [Mucor mucedo]|uniref:uncharacterized protein n=1 Tax=Mucor mucedo TaxID=29922 RepID=UPI00222121A5|nr:uncharacterized protein EV154DRAFT_487826 [Mucor mucedo]KAI7870289.1 hypothetical protein EV154DRAFT_487826 [Mucor mucedo]